MRSVLAILPALLLAFIFVNPTVMPAQSDCATTDVYLEALGEHADTLLRISVQLNTGGGALNNTATAAVNYKLLMSIREFHVAQRMSLPTCAQIPNDALIEAVDAAQDALALYFLVQLEPTAGYNDDFVRAVADFRQAYGLFIAARGDADV